MANQTLLLNVSDEMKSDDERLKFDGPERGEELCSFSLDTTEELYSSSEPDTCGMRHMSTKGGYVEGLEFMHFARVFKFSGQSNFGRKKRFLMR